MEICVWFTIIVRVGKTDFPLTAYHFYSSPQVERFRVHGHRGPVILEKHAGKGIGWKFISGKVVARSKKEVGDAFAQVVTAINIYLKERDPEMKYGHQVRKWGQSLLAKEIPKDEYEILRFDTPW
jgi:hypothetical protein